MIGISALPRALACAVDAAEAAGALMRRNRAAEKRVHAASRHDLKLELDVRCQALITRRLRRAFPGVAIVGEEGIDGDAAAPWRWVVDPIDGTVNFAYGIPHACVSIALQGADDTVRPWMARRGLVPEAWCPGYQTLLGVVYDPFVGELWTATAGGAARLNGRRVGASNRRRLGEAIITVGFAKHRESLDHMLKLSTRLMHRVRKLRIMGSAALALAYVATGRFDGYLETGVRLWDVAAGALIVECAGGRFWGEPREALAYRLVASNAGLHRALRRVA